MRIGIFTETYTPYISGLVTSEVMLKNALEQEGHEVYVVTANLESFKYEYDEKEKVLRIPGLPTGIYDSRLTSIYPIQAVNKIKSWKLDVIHSQTEFAIGTFARLIAKQYNIPLVHTYHTMYEDYIHYITKGFFKKSSKKLVEYFTKFYCDTTATELIVPTNKTYKLFKEKYHFEKNIHIIPTGIEVERFYEENIDKKEVNNLRKTLKIQKKDFIILFVGRLAEEKNVEFLIESQKVLSEKYNNIKLVIVGDGPDKEKYEEYSKKLGLTKNIIFTGKAAWGDMPYYYHISNIFATASKTETQGLTIIEAMASNVTPVCMRDEAFQSMVTEELNGLFFETQKEYQNHILNLYKNPEMLKKFNKQARIQAEHYSSKNYAERVLEVYNRAIKEKQAENRFGLISKIAKNIKERMK
ncbi:MAG: glycosyltransferase family 4 protein [Bacilli bacterium]|nr:glycosyltransferase family 4 protein [Bacilli bacterium]